jgi:hypothetical protein
MSDDYDLALFLSATGPCSLAKKPGKNNWVEHTSPGHLPNYICHIAKAIHRGKGHDTSSAIAIAVGVAKNWAHGHGKVTPATRAKAARAVAQWEALKAKAHAGHLVKASNPFEWGSDYILLASSDAYNFEDVTRAWQRLSPISAGYPGADVPHTHPDDADQDAASEPDNDGDEVAAKSVAFNSYSYVREVWNDFIIVEVNGPEDTDTYKVPYTVEDGDEIHFGLPKRVKQAWEEQPDDDLNDAEYKILMDELDAQGEEPVKLSRIAHVKTVGGAKKYNAPIGSVIQADQQHAVQQSPTVIRLISLYRIYKQAKGAGLPSQAEHALHDLNVALDRFPKHGTNAQALQRIKELLHD